MPLSLEDALHEAREEALIRNWFTSNTEDRDFIDGVAAIAKDLFAIKRLRGAEVTADFADVTLTLGDSSHRIRRKRWSQFADRGYIESTTKPTLKPAGERVLRIYARLLSESGLTTAKYM